MRLAELSRNLTRLTSKRSWLIGAMLAVAAVALAPASAAARTDNGHQAGGGLGPGCAPNPAIPHRAGGRIVRSLGGNARIRLIPCSTPTGYRTNEISVAVTNQGTVLFQPALQTASGLPIGLVRSQDQGGSWQFVNPGGNPPRTSANDMNMHVDRATGRVFYSNDLELPVGYRHPQEIDYSDDGGLTWSASAPLPMDFDHTQIFSGAPPSNLQGLQQGYPDVVYAVVAGGFSCAAYDFCGTHMTKSLDGGKTWGPAIALPYPDECAAPGVNPLGGYGLDGVVDRQGTIYVPFTPCERPYVAISHDEGSTWQLVPVADTYTTGWGELGLGIDNGGNLYAAWTSASNRLPYLAVSRDQGQHWTKPLMIGSPGVKEAFEPQLVAGATGQVAVTYYGSKNPPVPFPSLNCKSTLAPFLPGYQYVSESCPGYTHETWNTYITESFNGVDNHPLFWSATLNNPADPTWFGESPAAMRVGYGEWGALVNTAGAGGFNFDYYGMTMAPDDTPWVGYPQACPSGEPIPGNPTCANASGGPFDGGWGVLGRLVRQVITPATRRQHAGNRTRARTR